MENEHPDDDGWSLGVAQDLLAQIRELLVRSVEEWQDVRYKHTEAGGAR